MTYITPIMNFEITMHQVQRMQQRGFTRQMINTAIAIGSVIQKQGRDMVMVRDQDIPKDLNSSIAKRIKGMILILSNDGSVITTYKNRKHGFRDLKKKNKRNMKKH
jgi:hypothetical protein